jgi:predicted lactoylglutathione lyase
VKLTFVYQPVADVEAAAAFYRETLGFEEACFAGQDNGLCRAGP